MVDGRNRLLWILLLVLASNQVDRYAFGLMMQDIKVDLNLSDTQLGLLTGIAFALFYSVMGVPIARWADRGDRITIISLTAALWSGAVALCSAAAGFWHLLLIRIGVAVGEAGCIPPAHSLIADLFNRAERPRALARYMLGMPLGLILGYFAAGWLNEAFGWRVTFLLLGIPGLMLALVVRLLLKDPRRLRNPAEATAAASEPAPQVAVVCRTLWTSRTFRHLLMAYAVVAFFGWGISQWKAVFFIRSYGLGSGELGTWLAVLTGGGGLLGTWLGGVFATRFAAGRERLQLVAMAALYAVFAVTSMGVYLATDLRVAFALMTLGFIGGSAINGPLFATVQTLVPERMRAVSVALIYLFANLIGMGLGPLAAGALSDAYAARFGADSLRWALLTLCPGYLWAAWHLWRGARWVTQDLKHV